MLASRLSHPVQILGDGKWSNRWSMPTDMKDWKDFEVTYRNTVRKASRFWNSRFFCYICLVPSFKPQTAEHQNLSPAASGLLQIPGVS